MKEERRGREVEQLTFNNLQSKSDSSFRGFARQKMIFMCIITRIYCVGIDMNFTQTEIQLRQSTVLFFSVQLIQTISAVDTDEPLVGHKFIFSISPTNPNFTIVDREGEACVSIRLEFPTFRMFHVVASGVAKGSICVSPQTTRPTS